MPTTLALRFRAPRLQTTIFVTNRAATATTVISGVPCCAGNSDEAPCKCHLSVSRQGGIWSDPQHCQPQLYRLEKLLASSANFSYAAAILCSIDFSTGSCMDAAAKRISSARFRQ